MTTLIIILLLLLFMLLLLFFFLIFLLVYYKSWRYFSSQYQSITTDPYQQQQQQVGDLERPLMSEDLNQVSIPSDELERTLDLESRHLVDGNFSSPSSHLHVTKVLPAASLVVDVSDASDDLMVGQTLKRPLITNHFDVDQKHARKEKPTYSVSKDPLHQRSKMMLEVISGSSSGVRYSILSTEKSKLPFILGRVSPSKLLLKDAEVSGKHAQINWNSNKMKWELVDMGSLNGTSINSQEVCQYDSGTRRWSEPIELVNGDIINLGTTSKIYVQISDYQSQIPFGIGIAADPMALRRGGKKLPMEDFCYYQWPLPGVEQFGLFGVFDGHGGVGAAEIASKMLPGIIASMLSDTEMRDKVLSQCDASDVLRDAFPQTEAAIDHQYEGCTVTVLLVWDDGQEGFFAQCANLGDSACVISIGNEQFKMTEDHRITSQSERIRLGETGTPLREGETRLHGLNLARMLGDKFLKEIEPRFSSEPYISHVVHINKQCEAFALLASDGLWDVISTNKAVQLVEQTKERYVGDRGNTAEKIAKFMLSEARTLRTKDNTSIIFLDFDTTFRTLS